MATLMAPPRTPSPRVRIRSLSFDSPSSRVDITPIDDGPLSKSTGSLITLSSYDAIKAAAQEAIRSVRMLLPLNTKMSDDSILSDVSSPASSASSSPSSAGGGIELSSPPPPPQSRRQRPRPHPLQSAQHTSRENDVVPGPTSPFLYQDTSFVMYSPWLVRVVLDMYDVRGLDWMAIADPIERVWGIQTSSADVLGILSDNGRVPNRRWWD
jgi:hypothetical protein